MGNFLTEYLNIRLPLPIDVATNVVTAINKLYPNASWERSSNSIKLGIPDSDRFRTQEIQEAINTIEHREGDPASAHISYMNFSPDLISFSTVEDIARYCIPIVETAFAEIGAENYLEYRFQTAEQAYHLTFQKSDKFTPAELREQAVTRAEEAEGKLARYENPSQYETISEVASLTPNTIVTSTEGNVLVVTENGVLTVGSSQPVTEETEGFTAPYTVLREG